MSNDIARVEETNFFGAVDRFVTNSALVGLALIPSVFMIFLTPWRLVSMVKDESGSGRDRGLLAPGLFFLLSTIATILALANLAPGFLDSSTSANTVESGAVLGSDDVSQIASAWHSGELNQITITIVPTFGYCVLVFSATLWLRWIVGPWWSISTAIRSGFYIFGGIIGSTGILLTALLNTPASEAFIVRASLVASILFSGLVIWVFFWIFRVGGQISVLKGLAAAILATITVTVVSIFLTTILG